MTIATRRAALARLPESRDPDALADLRRWQARAEIRLRRLEAAARCPPADAEAWIVAIADTTRSCVFDADELRQHATVAPALARVLGPRSAKAVGQQLRRLKDRPIGGYVLRKVGRNASGCIWTLALHEGGSDSSDNEA